MILDVYIAACLTVIAIKPAIELWREHQRERQNRAHRSEAIRRHEEVLHLEELERERQ
jgi:Flp pilus assembly protein TadB